MSVGSVVLLATVVAPAVGAAAAALVRGERSGPRARVIGLVTTGITLLAAIVAVVIFDHADAGRMQLETNAPWITALDVRLHLGVDGISLPLVVLTALLTFLCAILIRGGPDDHRLVALLLLLEVGLIGTFVALDLVLFFVFFEVVLLPMWFVIARHGDGPERVRAATTFILFTVTGSAVMLVGFLVVHAETGTFDLVELADIGGAGVARSVQVLAALAMLLGLAVKTPMWPLHSWLPDAHTVAPTVGSVLLAGALLKMGTYGMVRVVLPVVPEGAQALAPYLGAFGVVGILYGSLACLGQTDLKRLVAYSSIGHMGFVLLGIATLTPAGVNGALVANIAHGLITGLLFFLAGAIKDRSGHDASFAAIGRAWYARAPRLGVLLAFAAVASLGLPGLAGFWGELLALLGAYQPADGLPVGLFRTLMALAGIGAVLTAAYLLQVVRQVCQGPAAAAAVGGRVPDVRRAEWWAWAPLVGLVLLLGLWPGLLLDLVDPAVRVLLAGGAG